MSAACMTYWGTSVRASPELHPCSPLPSSARAHIYHLPMPTSRQAFAWPLPHPRWGWTPPCNIRADTGLTPATSAPGLGSPLPHPCRDWAHPCHICARAGLTPATSAPGLGSPSLAKRRSNNLLRVLLLELRYNVARDLLSDFGGVQRFHQLLARNLLSISQTARGLVVRLKRIMELGH